MAFRALWSLPEPSHLSHDSSVRGMTKLIRVSLFRRSRDLAEKRPARSIPYSYSTRPSKVFRRPPCFAISSLEWAIRERIREICELEDRPDSLSTL